MAKHTLKILKCVWPFFNIMKQRVKIHKVDPAKFLSAPGLAWQAALK